MDESNKTAIKVENVSKNFLLPHERQSSLKSSLINFGKRGFEKQQVLQNISFEVKKGEFFGIVGRNGSGKSTLLKLMAGIYTPTEGKIEVTGKLTPFIELGVGFNPELTGRENVYLNGALLGFSRKVMEGMYDDIVTFAELERFMDQKLKNYSSGMQVRLAFSIAIRANSDILLLDEVLAVGDEAFQRKCYEYFEDLKRNKKTVILVTHDMSAVEKFCSRAILVDAGKIIKQGNPRVVAQKYKDLNAPKSADSKSGKKTDENGEEIETKPKPKYLTCEIVDNNKNAIFATGDKLTVRVGWTGLEDRDFESVGINIFKLSGEHVTGINSRTGQLSKDWRQRDSIELTFDLNLAPGKYYFEIHMFKTEGVALDSIFEGAQFMIKNDKPVWSGMTELGHAWGETDGQSEGGK